MYEEGVSRKVCLCVRVCVCVRARVFLLFLREGHVGFWLSTTEPLASIAPKGHEEQDDHNDHDDDDSNG